MCILKIIRVLLVIVEEVTIAIVRLVNDQLAFRAGAGDILRTGDGEGGLLDVVCKGRGRHRVLLGPTVLIAEDVVPVVVDTGNDSIADEIHLKVVDVVVLEVVKSLFD